MAKNNVKKIGRVPDLRKNYSCTANGPMEDVNMKEMALRHFANTDAHTIVFVVNRTDLSCSTFVNNSAKPYSPVERPNEYHLMQAILETMDMDYGSCYQPSQNELDAHKKAYELLRSAIETYSLAVTGDRISGPGVVSPQKT
jgi:hypothetical protein